MLNNLLLTGDPDNIMQAVEITRSMGGSLDVSIREIADQNDVDEDDLQLTIFFGLIQSRGMEIFKADAEIRAAGGRIWERVELSRLDRESGIKKKAIFHDTRAKDLGKYAIQVRDAEPGFPTYFFFNHHIDTSPHLLHVEVPFVSIRASKQGQGEARQMWNQWSERNAANAAERTATLLNIYRVAQNRDQRKGLTTPAGKTLLELVRKKLGRITRTDRENLMFQSENLNRMDFSYRIQTLATLVPRLSSKYHHEMLVTVQDVVDLADAVFAISKKGSANTILSRKAVRDFAKSLERKHGIILELSASDPKRVSEYEPQIVTLDSIFLKRDERKRGVGTAAMNDLIDWADDNGVMLDLDPSTDFGATSVARLRRFYGRFGFKRNLGRNKDFRTRKAMIRMPRRK
jgi:GNAT superfamily N-acetyltransferase